MKKLIALMLAVILVCSMIPMTASAAFDPNSYVEFKKTDDKWTGFNPSAKEWQTVPTPVFGSGDYVQIIRVGDKWKAYTKEGDKLYTITDEVNAWLQALAAGEVIEHGPWDHKLFWNSNTKYHWKECACGARFGEELHVDPLDTDNDYCICGYHFSDNADLVTLWIKGCPPIKYFNKNKTEYKLNAYTYKDFKEIKVSTKTFDCCATVELPEDLTLKEGENKFDIKVVSENKKVTKVYTVIITKDSAK